MVLDKSCAFFTSRDQGVYIMPSAHVHKYHELYFLTEGNVRFLIGGSIFTLLPGDMIFIPQGVFHQAEYRDEGKIERALIVFDDSFGGEELRPYVESLSKSKHIKIGKGQLHIFNSLFKKMEREMKAKDAEYREMLRMYVRQLMIMIFRYKENADIQDLGDTHRIIREAAAYIHGNCRSELTLGEVAKKFSLSPDYFSKVFKKETGVRFSEYLNICRVSLAGEMLAEGRQSVTQVALASGFNDSNYFTQVFKKLQGMTPKKYAVQFKKG